MPTLTQPMVGRDVVNPTGGSLAAFGDHEIMHPHGLRPTLGTQFAAIVLEVTGQSLLLGIDRERRVSGGDRGLDRRIDVVELRIAIGLFATLSRLAVPLVAERCGQLSTGADCAHF